MKVEVTLCDHCRAEMNYADDGSVEAKVFPEDEDNWGGVELHYCSLAHAAAHLGAFDSADALAAAVNPPDN